MIYKIAIDGPSSTGKSTVAKEVARKLSILYIDTGAMYRAVAFYLIDKGIDYNVEPLVCDELPLINIELFYEDNKQKIRLNGTDITEEIRTQEISNAASIISTYLLVREELVKQQQSLSKKKSVIMDGRDIGSVVLPDADLKIYLVCSIDERARRRQKQYFKKGVENKVEEVKRELEERDERDINREHSPLVKVDDAIEIDTTNLSIDEVVKEVIDLFKKKVKK